jgi:MFS family permease
VLLGIGFGLAMPALTSLTMAEVPERDAGVASGLFNTSQQVSGALGLAIAASLGAARSDRALADGLAAAGALTEGYTLAFTFAAGLVVASLLAAWALFETGATTRRPWPGRRRPRRPAWAPGGRAGTGG